MPFTATMFAAAIAAFAALAAAQPAAAQTTLGARVERAAPDATVSIRFAARDGVCGDGESFIGRTGEPQQRIALREGRARDGARDYTAECVEGPVRLAIERRARNVIRIGAYVGGNGSARAGEVELGDVAPDDAVAWLLDVARSSAEERAAGDAVFATTLAAVERDVWTDLFAIARDEGAPRRARTAATFWLGQAAGDRITAGLGALVDADDLDTDVRKHAIFALSQRRDGEGVPLLIEIARNGAHPELRRQALFWLAQSRDERALALFEELLIGRR